MIKVSIVIPIYNMEKYMEQCLDSILGQTLEEIELVCVNDGSTDRSLEILEKYQKTTSKLNIINQENQGVGIARNNGIKAAKGKYIAFMDPDDYYLEPETLADLYEAAEKNNVFICGGSLSEDHKNGQWIRKEFLGIYTNYTFEEEKRISYKDYQFDYGFYRFIYNREFLIQNDIFFPPYIRFQDPPFFVKAMIQAGEFYALPRIAYCYRYGHQNLKWDERRISAVLHGFIDNLTMSREAGLVDLHKLTVDRMLREYRDKLLIGLELNSSEVMKLLLEADHAIAKEWLEEDSPYKEGIGPLLYEWNKKALETEKDRTKRANAEYENIKNSTTFKVGKKVMAVPVKVKDFVKEKRRKQ